MCPSEINRCAHRIIAHFALSGVSGAVRIDLGGRLKGKRIMPRRAELPSVSDDARRTAGSDVGISIGWGNVVILATSAVPPAGLWLRMLAIATR